MDIETELGTYLGCEDLGREEGASESASGDQIASSASNDAAQIWTDQHFHKTPDGTLSVNKPPPPAFGNLPILGMSPSSCPIPLPRGPLNSISSLQGPLVQIHHSDVPNPHWMLDPRKAILYEFIMMKLDEHESPSPFQIQIFVESPLRKRDLEQKTFVTRERDAYGRTRKVSEDGLVLGEHKKHCANLVHFGTHVVFGHSNGHKVEGFCKVWTRKYPQGWEESSLGETGNSAIRHDKTVWIYSAAVTVEVDGQEIKLECLVPTKIVDVGGRYYDLEPGWEDVVVALKNKCCEPDQLSILPETKLRNSKSLEVSSSPNASHPDGPSRRRRQTKSKKNILQHDSFPEKPSPLRNMIRAPSPLGFNVNNAIPHLEQNQQHVRATNQQGIQGGSENSCIKRSIDFNESYDRYVPGNQEKPRNDHSDPLLTHRPLRSDPALKSPTKKRKPGDSPETLISEVSSSLSSVTSSNRKRKRTPRKQQNGIKKLGLEAASFKNKGTPVKKQVETEPLNRNVLEDPVSSYNTFSEESEKAPTLPTHLEEPEIFRGLRLIKNRKRIAETKGTPARMGFAVSRCSNTSSKKETVFNTGMKTQSPVNKGLSTADEEDGDETEDEIQYEWRQRSSPQVVAPRLSLVRNPYRNASLVPEPPKNITSRRPALAPRDGQFMQPSAFANTQQAVSQIRDPSDFLEATQISQLAALESQLITQLQFYAPNSEEGRSLQQRLQNLNQYRASFLDHEQLNKGFEYPAVPESVGGRSDRSKNSAEAQPDNVEATLNSMMHLLNATPRSKEEIQRMISSLQSRLAGSQMEDCDENIDPSLRN